MPSTFLLWLDLPLPTVEPNASIHSSIFFSSLILLYSTTLLLIMCNLSVLFVTLLLHTKSSWKKVFYRHFNFYIVILTEPIYLLSIPDKKEVESVEGENCKVNLTQWTSWSLLYYREHCNKVYSCLIVSWGLKRSRKINCSIFLVK